MSETVATGEALASQDDPVVALYATWSVDVEAVATSEADPPLVTATAVDSCLDHSFGSLTVATSMGNVPELVAGDSCEDHSIDSLIVATLIGNTPEVWNQEESDDKKQECADSRNETPSLTFDQIFSKPVYPLVIYEAVEVRNQDEFDDNYKIATAVTSNEEQHDNRESVVIPEGISPGESFCKNVRGWNIKVTCPKDTSPNDKIMVDFPAEVDILKGEKSKGRNSLVEKHPGNVRVKNLAKKRYISYKSIYSNQQIPKSKRDKQTTDFFRSIRQELDRMLAEQKLAKAKYWKLEKGAWMRMTNPKEIHASFACKFKDQTKSEKRKNAKRRKRNGDDLDDDLDDELGDELGDERTS